MEEDAEDGEEQQQNQNQTQKQVIKKDSTGYMAHNMIFNTVSTSMKRLFDLISMVWKWLVRCDLIHEGQVG